jgi:hypothetical protein
MPFTAVSNCTIGKHSNTAEEINDNMIHEREVVSRICTKSSETANKIECKIEWLILLEMKRAKKNPLPFGGC